MNKPIASPPHRPPLEVRPKNRSAKLPIDPAMRPSRLAIVVLCVIASISSLALIGVGTSLDSMQSWLKTTSAEAPAWAAPILFVVVSVLLMSLIVPKTMVSVSAGALFGTQLGGFLIAIIAVTAAALNYAIGRWCFGRLIEKRIDPVAHSREISPRSNWARVNWAQASWAQASWARAKWARALCDLASEGGFGFHLLFRFAPIPSMIVNYSMGAAKARMIPYLVGAAVGVLPQLLWVHGGTIATMDFIGNQTADIGVWRPVTAGISILAAIAVSVLVPKQVMRRIESMD